MTLDKLLQITEDIKEEVDNLPWHEDDIRSSFFALLYSGLYDYYIGQVSYEISYQIGEGKVRFTQDIIDLKPHIGRLNEIAKLDILSYGFKASLNRSIIYSSWTSFEMSLTLIFNQIITEKNFEVLIKNINNKLLQKITNLDNATSSEIFETLKKSSFIPPWRKFNEIIKLKPKYYNGNVQDDIKFIDLITTTRNCMIHANGLHLSENKTFDFNGVQFVFEKGKIFKQIGNNDFVSFEMALELKRIFKSLCNCIKHIKKIKYPEDKTR